jgi:hypothetical protein
MVSLRGCLDGFPCGVKGRAKSLTLPVPEAKLLQSETAHSELFVVYLL